MADFKSDLRRFGPAGRGAPQGVGTGSSGQPANTAAPAAPPPPQYSPNGYQPITNTHSIIEANRQNRLDVANRGNELNQQAGEAFNYYGGKEANYGNQAAGAYGQLQQNPGYTPGQASQINANYGQFNTPTEALNQQYLTQQEHGGISGNPYQAYSQPYQNAQKNISNSFADTYAKQMGGANYLTSGTGSAATGEQGGLNAAANRGDLNVTDQDVQDIRDAAGRRVGNQYQSMEEDLGRRASAAGSSPYAFGAMMSREGRQAAEQQGQAETEADIAARQYKLGAAQTQAGMQMGAAATGGQAQMQAAEAGGQAQMQAGYNTGNQALGEEQNMAGLGVSTMQTAEQQASQRAAALAANRQGTMQGIQATQYGQGTNSAQLTAGGAANVGQTQIAGQNAYRNYLTGEQQMAQQGQMGSLATQAGVYGAQNSGLNQSQANTNNYENGQHAAGVAQMGQILGAASAFFADGGVATRPTLATVGENGPEWVGPASDITTAPPDPSLLSKYMNFNPTFANSTAGKAIQGYQSGGWTGALKGAAGAGSIGQAYDKYKASSANSAAQAPDSGASEMPGGSEYAAGGTIVTKPTRVVLGERGPEAVVPLQPRNGNRLQPSMLGSMGGASHYGTRQPGFAPSPYSPLSRSVGPLRSMAGKYGQRITA